MHRHSKGQIAIEFLLLVGTGIMVGIIALISVTVLSMRAIDDQRSNQLNDYAATLQKEFLLATDVEDGYHRTLFIPATFNGAEYTLTSANTSAANHYLLFTMEGVEYYYAIPPIAGSVHIGENTLTKINGTLFIS